MTQFFGRFGGNVQRLATLQVQVEDNFQQASQRLGIFGNRLTSTSAIMTGTFVAAGAAAAGALVNLAASAARAGDEVAKGSDQIGFAVEGYQRWAEVLELAGSNIDVLSRGIGTLQTAQEGALRGVESYTAQFEALNVSIARANGELLTNQELVESIATSVLADDAVSQEERLAIGRLFGARAGRQFAGALENIGSGERLQQQLADATIFFNDEQARAAEDFQDALVLMRQELRLATVELGNAFVPAITDFITTITSGVSALNQADEGLFPTTDPASLPGFVPNRPGGGGVEVVYNPDGTVSFVNRQGNVGTRFTGLGGGTYTPPGTPGQGIFRERNEQREIADAVREGSALQFNAIQILEQVNRSLQTQTWDEMLAEIEAERAESSENWAAGLGLLDAMVEIGNRQNRAAGISAVNPFSQSASGFVNPIGARRSTREQAGINIFRPPEDATEAERLTRNVNYLRFAALAGQEDAAGNVQGFGIDAGEEARILAERDRLLEQGFNIRQGASGFLVSGERGGAGILTVHVNVGDETITRSFDRAAERGNIGLFATQDDVYNVRTG